MTLDKGPQIGRLALREEGENWNAYYAMPGTMEGAIFLGSIKLKFVMGGKRQQKRKADFMDFMRECVGDIIQESVGVRPVWGGAKDAPEHERTRR